MSSADSYNSIVAIVAEEIHETNSEELNKIFRSHVHLFSNDLWGSTSDVQHEIIRVTLVRNEYMVFDSCLKADQIPALFAVFFLEKVFHALQ